MKMKIQNGFTLIELMIVVAIIGILASIALPAYQDFIIRSQVIEGPSLSSELTTSLAKDFGDTGVWPANNSAMGIGVVSGNYVESITSNNGVVTITYGNKSNAAQLNGRVLTLRPAPNTHGNIIWICGTSTVPIDHTAVGTDATTVLGKHLPSACRS